MRQAWVGRGLAVTPDQAPAITGFGATPNTLRVAKAGDSSTLVVFVYPTQSALEQDWALGGSLPTPKEGKTAGSYQSAWWNQNVLVLLRNRGAGADDIREGFLALGPGVAVIGTAPAGGTGTPQPGTGTAQPAGTAPGSSPTPAGAAPTPTTAPVTPTPGRAPTQPPAISTPR